MLEDEYFDNLPTDPHLAIEQVIDYYNEIIMPHIADVNGELLVIKLIDFYEEFIEVFGLIETIIESHDIVRSYPEYGLTGAAVRDVTEINERINMCSGALRQHKAKKILENVRQKASSYLGTKFAYEFTEAEVSKIQSLITSLREQIANFPGFEEEHRSRLLRRLEKLQSEIHKKVSDLDRFWGLIGDAGVVIGKFGTDVEPIVARIREITDIIWGAQTKAEGIENSQPFPLLDPPKIDDENA